jgi:hypothetical protein
MADLFFQQQMQRRAWEQGFGPPPQRRQIDLRGTPYHRMNEAGWFSGNPANVGSQNEDGSPAYHGPIPYPKMLYHPEGLFRVTNPGQKVRDVDGSVMVIGQQEELVNRVVANAKEHRAALAEGWHETPAQALAAGNALGKYQRQVPVSTSAERIASLEAQIALLQAELKASGHVSDPVDGPDPEAETENHQEQGSRS